MAGVVGGMLLGAWGVAAFPWVLLALVGVAFLIAWGAHAHAFRPGLRTSGALVAGH